MMKRRHYLICSIIAMLSIVSYACETEYAICEGCGGTGGTSGDGNGPSENVCDDDDSQKCAESLNGRQVCSDGKWGNDAACNYCFNKNTDNSDATSLVCDGCTPNSYDKSGTEVCYKGAFKKFESKATSDDLGFNVALNHELAGKDALKDALWELVFNKTVTKSGSFEYYNCHNKSVTDSMINGNAWKSVNENSCCKENDYYIKRTGYKYYSVEVCRKVVFREETKADFGAYKYTSELNDSLIGKEDGLPYSFCHDGSILAAVNNDFDQDSSMMYQNRMCSEGYSCAFNGICLSNSFNISDSTEDDEFFVCEQAAVREKGISIKREHGDGSVGTCPPNMGLKQNTNGTWTDVKCGSQTFTLDKVRCAPIELSSRELTPIPKS